VIGEWRSEKDIQRPNQPYILIEQVQRPTRGGNGHIKSLTALTGG
jgi:hypothetical protein